MQNAELHKFCETHLRILCKQTIIICVNKRNNLRCNRKESDETWQQQKTVSGFVPL